MTLYGWYSEEAFKCNNLGYLYTDKNENNVLCTIVSDQNVCPYDKNDNAYKDNYEYVGELVDYIQLVKFDVNIDIKDSLEKLRRSFDTYNNNHKS